MFGSPESAAVEIGLVGCGRWGRHILRDCVTLGARVTVVLPSTRNHATARAGGAHAIVPTIDQLPEVDAIVIATPTTTHATVIRSVLHRNVPVFVEKPLTDDVAEAEAISRSTTPLFVMHKWRYHPGVEELARIAKDGTIGDLVGLRCTRVGWGNPHGDVDAIWMLAPHDISIALEILGTVPAPRAASAEVVRGTVTGVVALLGDSPWVAVEVSTAAATTRREIRLIGSHGIACLADSYADAVMVTTGDIHRVITRSDTARPISTEMPLLRELAAFLGYVRGGAPPKSDARDGLAEVATIAEIRRLAGLTTKSVVA